MTTPNAANAWAEVDAKAAEIRDAVTLQVISKEGQVKAEVSSEIADTPELRRQGLSKRACLPEGYGMFFDKVGAYWMKDVNFPLDIVFLDKQGTILEKQHMPVTQEPDPCKPLYVPQAKEAAHALELPAGWFERKGLEPGDRIRVVVDRLVS
jgi:uncharacterized membrane protein (UPF0127 family)